MVTLTIRFAWRLGIGKGGTRSIGTMLVLRFLLVANGVTLLAVGCLYLIYGEKPRGFIAAGVLIGAAVVLFCCIPLTDPYRRPKRRR